MNIINILAEIFSAQVICMAAIFVAVLFMARINTKHSIILVTQKAGLFLLTATLFVCIIGFNVLIFYKEIYTLLLFNIALLPILYLVINAMIKDSISSKTKIDHVEPWLQDHYNDINKELSNYKNHILWFSRHPLTDAQIETLKSKFGDDCISTRIDITFSVDTCVQVLTGYSNQYNVNKVIFAGVFPTDIAVELMAAGFVLCTFSNEPSARCKGVFICKGMTITSLSCANNNITTNRETIVCPVSMDMQEGSSLNPILR